MTPPTQVKRTARIKLERVRVTWAESTVRRYVGVDLTEWTEANRAIGEMIRAAHPGRGRERAGFVIWWVDGESYAGRIDLTKAREIADDRPLSRHVRGQLELACGRKRPRHSSAAEFAAYLRAQDPTAMAQAARLLDGYELGDEMWAFV